ncbi:type II secretion system protein [Cryobacterium sp. PH31-L1]|uniref:type IV pilus modification PilV family protein n=1 Tax=Cryobacterium sp. PH31-L1 TaxID=3046199 RepID=UPI0024B9A33F|nr:type II secretion system protein [Cryobacterium sp. PH31-L1]MDJ0376029.1 type II secretion system protein [Cryobacterium sp. PH31-L1]
MNTLLRHLGRRLARSNAGVEAGISLIEVLVAMLIFAIIAVGVGYGIVTSLYLSNDARSREVATNLAAQEIDLARSAPNVFEVLARTSTVVQNGTTFSVHRSTDWETSTGADGNCGSGGGQLRYRHLNVTVTWNSMRATTPVVRADSALAPGSRINDPALGTILVSVLTASGSGAAGVAISAVPNAVPNGAQTLSVAPPATDAQGCSYLLKVKPGTYDVSAMRPNFVDKNQAAVSVMTVGVAAGGAASVSFAYDLAGTVTTNYATNISTGMTLLPTDLHTTWRSTYAAYTPLNPSVSTTQTFRLHPFASGYQVFGGSYVAPTPTATPPSLGCVAVDPAAWTTPAPDGAIGPAAAQVATLPGGTAIVDVPLGVFTVTGLAGQYLRAVSQPAGAAQGDPGCALGTVYTFGPVPAGATAQFALPFGSFALSSGPSSGTAVVPVTALNAALLTRGSVGLVLTLDPRLVVAP